MQIIGKWEKEKEAKLPYLLDYMSDSGAILTRDLKLRRFLLIIRITNPATYSDTFRKFVMLFYSLTGN